MFQRACAVYIIYSMRSRQDRKKTFWRDFFAWGFFAASCAGYAFIMYQASLVGSVSSEISGTVGGMVPGDIVDDVYDPDNIIPIKNFAVTLSPKKDTYAIGDVISYSYTYEPADTSYKDIDLSFTPETAISVNPSSKTITCLEEGSAELVFTSAKEKKLTKKISINIAPVEGTGLSIGSDLQLSIGDVRTLHPVVSPYNTTDKRVSYQSSDSSIVSVSSTGTIKAVKSGEATITASLVSNPSITDSIKVTVKAETKVEQVTSLTLPASVSGYTKQNITITGSFLPKASSDFDFSKLVVTASDSKLSITKSSSSKANGSFTLTAKYSDGNISEPKVITVAASYDGATPLSASCAVTILPTMPLSTSMVSSTQKTSYSGSIVAFTHYASKTRFNNLTLKVTYSDSSVTSTPSSYKTSDVKWVVPSSLSLVSSSYKQAVVKPASTDAAIDNAEVYFYPNKNSNDHITYKVSYSLSSDSSSITGIQPLMLSDGMSLSTDSLFSDKLDCVLTLSQSTSNSSILSSSGYTAEIVSGASLASLSRSSSSGPYTLSTGSETGKITIRLVSTLDPAVKKDISIDLVKNADKCAIEFDGDTDISSVVTMQRGTIASLKFLTGMRNSFSDGTYQDKFWYDDDFEIAFSKENIFAYTKSSSQLLAYSGTKDDIVRVTLTSTKNPSLVSSIDINIDYTAPNADGFSLAFDLLTYPGKEDYNKPKTLSKIAVGTTMRAMGKVNSDASVQSGYYASSNADILSVDSFSGVVTALKPGIADIEFHSNDDTSVFVSKTITVVDSTGPFKVDFDAIGAMSYELAETYDGVEFARMKLAYGKSYTLHVNKPSYATSSAFSTKLASFQGEECDKGVLGVNKSGVITTVGVGRTFVHIIYGDKDSITKFEYVIEVKVERDIKSFWGTFLYKVRKLVGHFGAFMACAVCSMAFVGIRFKKLAHRGIGVFGSLYAGFTFAGLSELVQKYTEGRYGCWADIWIDFKGTMIGTALVVAILLAIILIKLLYKKLTKPDEKNEK